MYDTSFYRIISFLIKIETIFIFFEFLNFPKALKLIFKIKIFSLSLAYRTEPPIS